MVFEDREDQMVLAEEFISGFLSAGGGSQEGDT